MYSLVAFFFVFQSRESQHSIWLSLTSHFNYCLALVKTCSRWGVVYKYLYVLFGRYWGGIGEWWGEGGGLGMHFYKTKNKRESDLVVQSSRWGYTECCALSSGHGPMGLSFQWDCRKGWMFMFLWRVSLCKNENKLLKTNCPCHRELIFAWGGAVQQGLRNFWDFWLPKSSDSYFAWF